MSYSDSTFMQRSRSKTLLIKYIRIFLQLSAWLWLTSASAVSSEEIASFDGEWKLDFERDGIQIFTQKHADSKFEAFKAVATLNAPLENIMAVMSNPGSCMEWVHNCIESWGFEELSYNKRYAYSVNDLPWPVKDRDYVIEIVTDRNNSTGEIEMHIMAVQDKMPEKKDYVRVNIQETHYFFKAIDAKRTQMTWIQHTEPGGAIPSWLVNALIVDIPYKSMRSLEQVAHWPKYSNAEILIDGSGQINGVEVSK